MGERGREREWGREGGEEEGRERQMTALISRGSPMLPTAPLVFFLLSSLTPTSRRTA